MTVRVHELAKKLDISSKDLIQKLEHAGITVKNNLSSLSEEDVKYAMKNFKSGSSAVRDAEQDKKPAKKMDAESMNPQEKDAKQLRPSEKKEPRTEPQKERPGSSDGAGKMADGASEKSPKPVVTSQDQRHHPEGQAAVTGQRSAGERPPMRPPQEQKNQGTQRSQGERPFADRSSAQRNQSPYGQRLSLGDRNSSQPPRQNQGQGQRTGQGQRQGMGQGQRQGGQGQYQGQGQGQYQGQRQGQGYGQRPGQGQGYGQRPGQSSGQGQGYGQRPGQSQGQGQRQYQGARPGQSQGQGQGQRSGQNQGTYGNQSQGGRPGYQGQRPAGGYGQGSGGRPSFQGQGQGQGQGPRSYGNRPPGQGFQGQGQGQRPAQQGQRFGDRPAGQGNRPFGQRHNETAARPAGRPGEGRPGQAGRGLDKKAPTMQRIRIDGKTAELSVAEQPAKRQAPNKKKAQDSRTYAKPKQTERDISALRHKGRGKPEKTYKAPVPATPKHIIIPETISVQEFASRMSRKAGEVIKTLMTLGVLATINQEIDGDTAVVVGNEMGVVVEVRAEKSMAVIEDIVDNPEELCARPPVVTVMGHVDHGKTSLLDAIRQTNVIASEAGGITQHIGAYQVEIKGQKITFLDTPGHEAFTAMRARGAQVTDVAVLVVAADDGIMPQTVEAINHAKAAHVPIVVAINKIDKEGANPDRVKQELTEQGLVLEEWGGETIAVDVSAKARINIEQLLEMIVLVAEMKELKANPSRKATGTVIEAKLDRGKGPVATVLVEKGTLTIGDVIIAGPVFGKIRAMVDDKSRRVKKVPPGTPVEIQGLSEVPEAGEIFHVVEDEKIARQVATARVNERKAENIKQRSRINLDDLFDRIKEGEVKELNIIIKGDVQGSVEAIRESLCKLSTVEVRVHPIHGGVGAISENDVMLAAASNAIILGFNVRPDTNTKEIAELQGVDIRLYRVIYDAINDVKSAMEGLLDPEFKEVSEGRAEVRQVFKVPKAGTVAGSYVTEGKITRSSQARLIRDGIVIFEGEIDSLRRFKDDVKTVMEGYECGIGLKNYNDLKEGDVIETFIQEQIQRAL